MFLLVCLGRMFCASAEPSVILPVMWLLNSTLQEHFNSCVGANVYVNSQNSFDLLPCSQVVDVPGFEAMSVLWLCNCFVPPVTSLRHTPRGLPLTMTILRRLFCSWRGRSTGGCTNPGEGGGIICPLFSSHRSYLCNSVSIMESIGDR